MSIETTMARYYADRAAEYERIYQKPERQADLLWLREFVERTLAGADVLEIACGTGYWTQVVARSAASVVATDLNEEVLNIARSKPIDPQRATIRRADAYSLDVLDSSYTGGLAAFWWSHVKKSRLQEFLANFHRVLSPGARVVFIDNLYVEGSSTPVSRSDAEGNTYQQRRLDDGTTHEVLKNFPTAAELRAAAPGSATDVRVELLRYYWVLSYVRSRQ